MVSPQSDEAARPYPLRYVSSWTAKNGMQAVIRPICPEMSR
jgi:hypothetical protein